MLKYNFKRMFKARGIERPHSFLQQSGFSSSFATKVVRNRCGCLNPRELEKLCIVLYCTPTDLMEWVPEEGQIVDESHPLNAIRQTVNVTDISKTLNSVPPGHLREIDSLIHAWLEKRNAPPAG